MIVMFKGVVVDIQEQSIVLCTDYIGFEILVPNPSSFSMKDQAELYIHTHWNQEQGPSFYGFRTKEEKTVFQCILKCPGIGPKIALAAIEYLGAKSLVDALISENSTVLSSIPGIGKKKAEQLVVQLKHHVSKLVDQGIGIGQGTQVAEIQKISEVLDSLNYSRSEINIALEYVRKNNQDNLSFDLLLRKALAYLSKRV